jgi:secreted trypsin-like serine protease
VGAGHSGDRDALPGQDRWRVRIRGAANNVLGGGILLGAKHVLTCAHILGTEPAAPDISVEIDFVDLGNVPSARARVAVGGWAPPNDEDGRDIALRHEVRQRDPKR